MSEGDASRRGGDAVGFELCPLHPSSLCLMFNRENTVSFEGHCPAQGMWLSVQVACRRTLMKYSSTAL